MTGHERLAAAVGAVLSAFGGIFTVVVSLLDDDCEAVDARLGKLASTVGCY